MTFNFNEQINDFFGAFGYNPSDSVPAQPGLQVNRQPSQMASPLHGMVPPDVRFNAHKQREPQLRFAPQSKLEVMNFMLQRVEGYNTFGARPYHVSLDGTKMNILQETVEQCGGVINSTALAGISGHILAQSSTPMYETTVPQGWASARYRYILTLKLTPMGHENTTEYILVNGYSEYYDPSFSGHIPPGMPFYITSVQRFLISNQTGNSMQMLEFNKVIGPANTQDIGLVSPGKTMLIRPQDVAQYKGAGSALNQVASDHGINFKSFMVGGGALGVQPEKISWRFEAPARWLSELLYQYNVASSASRIDDFTGASSVYDDRDASTSKVVHGILAQSGRVAVDPLMNAVARSNQLSYLQNSFTLNQLTKVDPYAMSKVNMTLMTGNSGVYGLLGGHFDGDDINSTELEASIAFRIAGGIAAYLTGASLSYAQIALVDTEPPTPPELIDAQSALGDIDFTFALPGMLHLIQQELVRPACAVGDGYQHHHYMLTIRADVFGDTSVTLSINGGGLRTYVYPTFMSDALSSNVVRNENVANNLYAGASAMVDTLFN